LQRKVSQHLVAGRFRFVPNLDMSREWSDADLFELFALDAAEIAYINKTIGERDWIDSLDSPIPSTHLPGGRKHRVGDAPDDTDDGDEE
jgi:site-specific DNA-methyltransferase (adenine-specific)